MAAMMGGTVDTSAGRGESRYRLIEDFSDFQKAGSLTLPKTYKISYSFYNSSVAQLARTPNRELELEFNTVTFSYNNPLEAGAFDVSAQ
jgi:hypothetical protein